MEKLVYGGDALGRIDGRVVFAPRALPGELVEIEVVSEKKDLIKARVANIIEASPDRVEPRCPHFARCGGCDYQHLDYTAQVNAKVDILREVLQRVGRLEAPETIETVTGPEWEYRNRIQLHFAGRNLGFHEPGTHKVAPIEQCDVTAPLLQSAIKALRSMTRDRRWPDFVASLELFTNGSEIQLNVLDSGTRHLSRSFFDWCGEQMPLAEGGSMAYEVAGREFRVSHKSFFQVNRFLVDRLLDLVTAGRTGRRAIDLYAGVGLFALRLAAGFEDVVAVEAVGSAARDLEANADGQPVAAVQMGTEPYLAGLTDRPDLIVADPPRAGLGREVVSHLVRLAAAKLVLVSCDPATLARDLSGLVAGGYTMDRMVFVDLFPHTAHIETVVELSTR